MKIVNPNIRFVRIYQAQQDFMIMETAAGDYIQPLISNAGLNITGDSLYTPDQVLPQLNEEVQKSIESWNTQMRKTR